jgi:tRNA(fMet)-specific endonuclease VapC
VLVPFVVVAELRAGFAVGTQGRANERFLQRFLAKAGVEVAYATDATAHHYASLFRQLRQQGTPVPTNDLWIAALVTEHGASLCTRDAHFDELAQLDVV